MQQKIGVNGTATIAAALETGDPVVAVVIGPVASTGQVLQATGGRTEVAAIRMEDLLILRGPEADEWRARVKAENDAGDESIVNGGGGGG